MIKKIGVGIGILWLLASVGSAFSKSNPPVENQVKWDSKKTEELFYRACADCHSHETKWPWYSNIAPVSFPVIHHVNEGREHFNISAKNMGESYEAAEELEEGEMPEGSYLIMHPEADLSTEEKKLLIAGLKKTFGTEDEHEHKRHEHDH